jgi:spoIIIJ-associated protein
MSDRQMERGQQWLEELLKQGQFKTGVKAEKQALYQHTAGEAEPGESDGDLPEADSYWLTIDETKLTPTQINALTGPSGATLDAIQYLANSILNLGQERELQGSYTIELNGYRVRRLAELRALALEAADTVRSSGEEVELKSLSSAERRMVHTFFQDCDDIETYSRGSEPDRRLVLRLR